MYLTEKDINYADLVVPFVQCPFDKADDDCPFEQYWKLPNANAQINAMKSLPEEELDKLQEHHKVCLLNKLRRFQEDQ